ncbi:MAG TPA: CRTAC1 family protein, partial [Candidatus Dormibacteraeota bacterium]|nr:CRTAC1 family protein [Candidatus Dormibacteraeota bacterium]
MKKRNRVVTFPGANQLNKFGRRGFLQLLLSGLASGGSELASPFFGLSPSVPLFREVAEEIGLNFHHFTGAIGEYYMPEIMGAGVALFDYDNDGDLDVYLIQGTTFDPAQDPGRTKFPPIPGWKPGNRLFRNLLTETGKLQFVDVTEKAGVGHVGYGMGVAVGDYDNDGFQDLYVTNFGHNVLYHNNGNGTFTDVTAKAGVDDPHWSTSAAWVDYDRDGRLDLFVANYLDFTVKGNKHCYASTGERDYCTPKMYQPAAARLFRNRGDGTFEDVTEAAGIGAAIGPGLGVVCADFNRDGWPDIYVANDGAAAHLWINQRNGTFKEAGLLAGAAYSIDGLPQAGMGVTAGDFDGDGDEDIFKTNLTNEGANLYVNDGHGNFYEAAAEFGLLLPTFPYTGFGTEWFDYDNDGRLDLFIANGAVNRIASMRESAYPFGQPNQLFHNEGKKFREMTAVAGPAFAMSEVSRGAAFGDINNDGAVDIVVTNNNGPVRLLLNQSRSLNRNHWLLVRLEAVQGNGFAIGATVEVRQRGQTLLRRAHTDSSYLSANDVRVHFGLGEDLKVE